MADSVSACTISICESGKRWQRAFQYHLSEDRIAIRCVQIAEAGALMINVRPLVVVWEVGSAMDPVQIARAVSVGARLQQPPLQFAAVSAECCWTPKQFVRISLGLRQLGVAAVLKNPEDLKTILPLIERYRETCFA